MGGPRSQRLPTQRLQGLDGKTVPEAESDFNKHAQYTVNSLKRTEFEN